MPEKRHVRLKYLSGARRHRAVTKIGATLAAALLAAHLVTGPALAAGSGIDATRSTILATFTQEGVGVEVPFTGFSGHIVYDPDNTTGSSAAIEVITGSLDLGDEAYNEEVRKKAWFDSETYPHATFQSTSIEVTGEGQFTATGELEIKGKSQTITVPIAFAETPEGEAFDGAFELSRRAFGIGEPMWDEVLEDKVIVRFHLFTSHP